MLVMLMMTEALAHIHSEFLTRNLVIMFKLICWAIFCPYFDQYGSSVAEKVHLRLSHLYSTFELPSSPMLAVLLVQTHCLLQKFISVVCHFQSAKKTKVQRREPTIVCTQHLDILCTSVLAVSLVQTHCLLLQRPTQHSW